MNFDNATNIKKQKDPATGKVLVVKVEYTEPSGEKVAMSIPMKEVNTDYKNLLEWAAIDGNNIEEAD